MPGQKKNSYKSVPCDIYYMKPLYGAFLTICAVYFEWLHSVVVLPYQAQEPYNPKAEVSGRCVMEKKNRIFRVAPLGRGPALSGT